jgi:hypothetical protein
MGPLRRRLTTDATPLALKCAPLPAGQSGPFLSTKLSADSPLKPPAVSQSEAVNTIESISRKGCDPSGNRYDPDHSPPIGCLATVPTWPVVDGPNRCGMVWWLCARSSSWHFKPIFRRQVNLLLLCATTGGLVRCSGASPLLSRGQLAPFLLQLLRRCATARTLCA